MAQLLMTPVQSWSAVHPDFRTNTLVILGQTNVLLLRDYTSFFRAWETASQQDDVHSTLSNPSPDLLPRDFLDLWFANTDNDADNSSWDDQPSSQLSVASARAMCIVVSRPPMAIIPSNLLRASPCSLIWTPQGSPETLRTNLLPSRAHPRLVSPPTRNQVSPSTAAPLRRHTATRIQHLPTRLSRALAYKWTAVLSMLCRSMRFGMELAPIWLPSIMWTCWCGTLQERPRRGGSPSDMDLRVYSLIFCIVQTSLCLSTTISRL